MAEATATDVPVLTMVVDVDFAVTLMRERGLRVLAARRLVVEALLAADGPVSAEQIADGIGGRVPSSDIASVCRNLQAFEGIGLARHVHLGHGPGLHALAVAATLRASPTSPSSASAVIAPRRCRVNRDKRPAQDPLWNARSHSAGGEGADPG